MPLGSTVSAYTKPITPESVPITCSTLLLRDKYVPAGTGEGVANAPLGITLTEPWESDAHFAQYSTPAAVRLRKDTVAGQRIVFRIAAFDLDFNNHQSKPTDEDFERLVRVLNILDEVPNIAYPTRGGARLVYFIQAVHDPDQFEAHYYSAITRFAAAFKALAGTWNGGDGYEIDMSAKDWTRLFRAPRVVRDEVSYYDTPVLMFHDDPLDLLTFKVKEKPKPKKYDGTAKWSGYDPALSKIFHGIGPGCRNSKLFAAFCHIINRYEPASAESLLDTCRQKAQEVGLDDDEIDRTLASARKKIGGAQ